MVFEFHPFKFSFNQQFFFIRQKFKVSKWLLCLCLVLFSIFIFVTFVLFLELKSWSLDSQSHCFLYFLEKWNCYLFILNFNVISCLYWVLILFDVKEFFIWFILRNSMEVPSEQNVFVAPQLGFSLVKIIGGSLELCLQQTPPCSKTFCFRFCYNLYIGNLLYINSLHWEKSRYRQVTLTTKRWQLKLTVVL